MYSVPYLSTNKITIFHPPYSAVLLMEDLWFNCVAFSLYSITLLYNFAPLPGSPFICGPTPLYKLMPEVI